VSFHDPGGRAGNYAEVRDIPRDHRIRSHDAVTPNRTAKDDGVVTQPTPVTDRRWPTRQALLDDRHQYVAIHVRRVRDEDVPRDQDVRANYDTVSGRDVTKIADFRAAMDLDPG
jgi:hypothetical protein